MASLFILSRAASDPLNKAVVDMIFSSAAFGQAPDLVFCGEALSLLTNPNSDTLPLGELAEFGLGSVYALSSVNEANSDEYCLAVTWITPSELQALIRSAQLVQSF